MELNDNEFDATFREKVFDADPQFEEAAWNKMEQKLRRRDRVVFFRKAGALCLLLLIAFGSYILVDHGPVKKTSNAIAEKNKPKPVKPVPETDRSAVETNTVPKNAEVFYADRSVIGTNPMIVFADTATHGIKQPTVKQGIVSPFNEVTNKAIDSVSGSLLAQSAPVQGLINPDSNVVALPGSEVGPASVSSIVKKQKSKRRSPLPMSLSLSAGPEFNSSSALVGGKRGFSTGITIGFGVAKHLTLLTGLKYSAKDYATDGYDYKFRNERVKPLISGVDASCAVLEIPVQVSYTVLEDVKKSIDINAGMSSYFMLKEDYTFKYTAESGFKDRFQEINNRNQHFFGVVDLSVAYYIKLKKEKFRLGLEPYVKIPITGVGEGKVNLKSSGLSLKLRYDLGKKNK
jgi:hypothetical protein